MLFSGWEVRILKNKIFASEIAQGRRPRVVCETEGKYFSAATTADGK